MFFLLERKPHPKNRSARNFLLLLHLFCVPVIHPCLLLLFNHFPTIIRSPVVIRGAALTLGSKALPPLPRWPPPCRTRHGKSVKRKDLLQVAYSQYRWHVYIYIYIYYATRLHDSPMNSLTTLLKKSALRRAWITNKKNQSMGVRKGCARCAWTHSNPEVSNPSITIYPSIRLVMGKLRSFLADPQNLDRRGSRGGI